MLSTQFFLQTAFVNLEVIRTAAVLQLPHGCTVFWCRIPIWLSILMAMAIFTAYNNHRLWLDNINSCLSHKKYRGDCDSFLAGVNSASLCTIQCPSVLLIKQHQLLFSYKCMSINVYNYFLLSWLRKKIASVSRGLIGMHSSMWIINILIDWLITVLCLHSYYPIKELSFSEAILCL